MRCRAVGLKIVARLLSTRPFSGGTMAKEENGRIVETAMEARGAERGPTIRNVLVAGTGLVVAAFVIVYLVYFAA
jgi:hypothetical protein